MLVWFKKCLDLLLYNMKPIDQIEQGIEFLSEKRVRDFKQLIDEAVADLGGLKKIRKPHRRTPIKFSPAFQEKLESNENTQVIIDFFKKYIDKTILMCCDLFRLRREIYWRKEVVDYSIDVDLNYDRIDFIGYGSSGKESEYLISSFRCSNADIIKLILGVQLDFDKTPRTKNGLPVAMRSASGCSWSFCFGKSKKCKELSKIMQFICPWACVKKEKREAK